MSRNVRATFSGLTGPECLWALVLVYTVSSGNRLDRTKADKLQEAARLVLVPVTCLSGNNTSFSAPAAAAAAGGAKTNLWTLVYGQCDR